MLSLHQIWFKPILKVSSVILCPLSVISHSVAFFWPLFPGWNKQVDYEPGTGSKQLFPKMHLETCGGPLSSVRTTVELQTSHIGKGCDRETYSEKSLQKLCGELSKRRKNKKKKFPFCVPLLSRRDQIDKQLKLSLPSGRWR